MYNCIIYTSIFVVLCFTSVLVVCEKKPLVDTTHGKISGKILRTLYNDVEYAAFMGIPYAVPPVKELRFMPPQPMEPWENVLTATKEKKACAQFNHNVRKQQSLGFYGSEDCLYLDIFTPAVDDAKRAVMMFIYNEHFINSYNKSKDYQPDFFIEEDVVTITISHRLSAFGFLSLEDKTLWGNAGLKDIVAGLEWVRSNIERFGGDPTKITLMGSQGGASAIDLLLHSKKKDLFQSAILQEGSSWESAYLQDNVRERAFELARLTGNNPITSEEVIKDLNNAAIINITSKDLHASPKDHFKETQRSVVSFAPIVEKDPDGLIVDYPENATSIDTPMLLGFNSRAGLDASLHYLIEPRYISFLKKDFPLLFPIRVNFAFDPLHEALYDAIEEVKKFYFKDGISVKRVTDYVTYMSDVLTSYSVDYAARIYAKISKSPLYYYHFDYYSDLNENKNNLMKLSVVEDGTWGAAAGDELCYLFKCPDLVEQYLKHNKEMSEERNVQRKLVKMWTNFAKYGNPTPDDDTTLEGLKWPIYNLENKQYLEIGKKMEIKQDLNKNRFQFWDDFFERWGKRAVKGVITEVNKKDELYNMFVSRQLHLICLFHNYRLFLTEFKKGGYQFGCNYDCFLIFVTSELRHL